MSSFDPRLIARRIRKTSAERQESFAKAKTLTPDIDSWTTEPGILGFGIGRKKVGDDLTDQLAMQVFVRRKRDPGELDADPTPQLVESVSGSKQIPTDVVEVGDVELLCDPKRTARPALPGVGLAHPGCAPGTFGCLVRAKDDPARLFVLSNAHVLGADGFAQPGDPIFQPGESRNPADIIATFAAAIPFEYGLLGDNQADAAIALVTDRTKVNSEIESLGRPPKGRSTVVRLDGPVRKSGRTTCMTAERIVSRGCELTLRYPSPGGDETPVHFTDLVMCPNFTRTGDSGAVVLNGSDEVIGLVFAGSSTATFFCRIKYVLEGLDVRIVNRPI